MTEPFGSEYAAVYDALYGDKNYDAEVRAIERAFSRWSARPVRKVLDLGCGSGNHGIRLAQAGFEVTGIDRSAPMLAEARAKTAALELVNAPQWVQGDIRNAAVVGRFDAALMMFAVLGYQIENEDAVAALRTARRHLHPGSLLFFDCWYGPAVLAEGPAPRIKTVETSTGPLRRYAEAELDVRRQIATVRFRVEQASGESSETHAVRFFFPRELELLLERAGFELLHLGGFPDWEAPPAESDWNAAAIARALPRQIAGES